MTGTIAEEIPWYRFSRYEIRDEWIFPAADSRLLASNPWEGYRPGLEGDDESPYGSLLRLAAQLDEITAGSSEDCFEERCQACCRWCDEFGLLGLDMDAGIRATIYPRPLPKRAIEPNLRRHGERVQTFMMQAWLFRDAVLNSKDRGRKSSKKSWGMLNLLAQDCHPMIVPGKNGFVQKWRSASLIGAYAAMAQLDLLQCRQQQGNQQVFHSGREAG